MSRFLDHNLLVSVFRLCVWLILLSVIFVPLERLFALHPQKIFRKAILTDVAYFFLGGLIPGFLLGAPLALVAWLVHQAIPGTFTSALAASPAWLRIVAALVVVDIGAYWGHRWTHEIPFLWRFHAIHHGAEQLDFLVSTRILVGAVWGFFVHANVHWRFGPLERLIATPAFHHWHHTNEAALLPWVDGLFGTLYLPKDKRPAHYGIDESLPGSFLGQLVRPFLISAEETRVKTEA